MNFPADQRHPKCYVAEDKVGKKETSWSFGLTFQDGTKKQVPFASTPPGATYSFCKCSALTQIGGKYVQYYMTKISQSNVVRNYELKVIWNKDKPTAEFCEI